MKTILSNLLCFIILSSCALAEEIIAGAPSPVEITRFLENCAAAVSYTFDDGTLGHYLVVAPMREKYGFRGTFGVVAGITKDDPESAEKSFVETGSKPGSNSPQRRRVSWKEWRELSAKGHEIANHSLTHAGLPGLPPDRLDREVNESARIITEKVARPLSFIYPGNGRNQEIQGFVLKTHIATRYKEQRFGGPGFNAEMANGMMDKAIQNGEAIIIMTHAVAEAGYQTVSEADLDAHLKHMSTIRDKIWVDTLANVTRYVRERDDAKVMIQTRAANRVTFELACPLDPTIFNVPLTCRINAGGPVETAECERGGVAIPTVIAVDKILVNVVPGSVPVTVRWTTK